MQAFNTLFRTVLASTALLASTAAFAQPQLVSSTPADQSTVTAPIRIELHFSEVLAKQSSAARLTMTTMDGMDMPMKMPVKVTPGDDARTMILTPTTPLHAGGYRVDWRAGSADAATGSGFILFTVK